MRPPARACECCESVPQQQLGNTTVFPSGREVLESLRGWRVAHPRAPLANAMCFPNDVSKPGGKRCRGEGGEVCQGENNPCLLYAITAPYYQANIPFLVNNQQIRKKVEKLLEEERKVERNRNKNSAAEIAKRAGHQENLDKTFSIVRDDVMNLIELCPVR